MGVEQQRRNRNLTIDWCENRPVLAVRRWNRSSTADEFDVRSDTCEQLWLPTLGPSALWLLRRFAHLLDEHPDGFTVDTNALGATIGVRSGGRNSALTRTVGRLVDYNTATIDGDTLCVRTTLNARHGPVGPGEWISAGYLRATARHHSPAGAAPNVATSAT